MENLELMPYNKQTRQPTQQELTGYRSLAAAIFSQAVFDATDKRGTVEKFIGSYTWLKLGGYYFLTEILAMDLDQSKYDRFLNQLKSGEYEMFRSIFSKKEVQI